MLKRPGLNPGQRRQKSSAFSVFNLDLGRLAFCDIHNKQLMIYFTIYNLQISFVNIKLLPI